MSMNPFADGPLPPFETQSNENGIWTGVRAGFDRDTQQEVTDFLVVDETGQGIHTGINDMGVEVFSEPHQDRMPQ